MKSFSEVPRLGFWRGLRLAQASGGGRVDMLSGLRDQYERLGPVVVQISRPFKMVNLFGPDANRTVLMDRDQIFSAGQPWNQIMGRIFTNGLLLRDGADHKQHRKIMHEAFTRPALRDYASRMNPIIARGIADFGASGAPILAFRAYEQLTLELAANVFVGMDLGPSTRPMNEAFEHMVAASMSRVRLPVVGREFQRVCAVASTCSNRSARCSRRSTATPAPTCSVACAARARRRARRSATPRCSTT